jgi:hypothetical protein
LNEASCSESDSDVEIYEESFVIDSVNDEFTEDEWCIELETNGTTISYKIDSGHQANIIPITEFNKLKKKPKLREAKCRLTAFNGTNIPVKGSCILFVKRGNSSLPISFIVADIDCQPIVGLTTSSRLNLIKRVRDVKKRTSLPDYLSDFKDCFGALGCLNVKPIKTIFEIT